MSLHLLPSLCPSSGSIVILISSVEFISLHLSLERVLGLALGPLQTDCSSLGPEYQDPGLMTLFGHSVLNLSQPNWS